MRKLVGGAIALAASAVLAGTASAASGTANFSAVITQAAEDPPGYDDPRFAVGDVLTFSATLSDIFILPGTPYYGARAYIPQLDNIPDLNDGYPSLKILLSTGYAGNVVEYPSPIVIFTADRVVGVIGAFLRSDGGEPGYAFPSSLSGDIYCGRANASLDYGCAKGGFDLFLGTAGEIIGGYYANTYPNSYVLEFDWGSSSVDANLNDLGFFAVPEPVTWALMIVGFGATGAILRRKAVRGMVA